MQFIQTAATTVATPACSWYFLPATGTYVPASLAREMYRDLTDILPEAGAPLEPPKDPRSDILARAIRAADRPYDIAGRRY